LAKQLTKTTGDVYVEECPECSATFKAITEKQAKAQLKSHAQSHEEDDGLSI